MLGSSPELWRRFVEQQFAAQDRHYRTSYPDSTHDVVLVDGLPIGQLRVHRDETQMRLIDVSLVPSARGRGVGSRLVRELQEEAKATGRQVALQAWAQGRARGLYGRLGFIEAACSGAHVAMTWVPDDDQLNTAS